MDPGVFEMVQKRKTANWSIAMQRADQLSTTTGVDFLFFEFRNCFASVAKSFFLVSTIQGFNLFEFQKLTNGSA